MVEQFAYNEKVNGSSPLLPIFETRGCGGIGRHTRFRPWGFKSYGFKSCHPYFNPFCKFCFMCYFFLPKNSIFWTPLPFIIYFLFHIENVIPFGELKNQWFFRQKIEFFWHQWFKNKPETTFKPNKLFYNVLYKKFIIMKYGTKKMDISIFHKIIWMFSLFA